MDTFTIPKIYTSSLGELKKENPVESGEDKAVINWNINKRNQKLANKGRLKIGWYGLIVIIIFLLFVFGRRPATLLFGKLFGSKVTKQVKGEQVVYSQKMPIDKQFTFLGIDESGKKKDELTLTLTEVEKTDQVMVQEKTYTSKNEKTFLIVNLELRNDTTKRLNLFPGDLIRLMVGGDKEKLFAPDLHNNYVLVAPISTKVDRIGFVIDKSAKDLKLQVGELEEEKEVIELKFNN